MARAQPITLTTRSFPTKTAAKAYFRLMLKKYSPGDRVSDQDADDLGALLKLHPQSAEKIGPGIDHFEVMSADYNTKCFWVVRSDQTIENFSYKVCVDG